jgi:hypothetical protein
MIDLANVVARMLIVACEVYNPPDYYGPNQHSGGVSIDIKTYSEIRVAPLLLGNHNFIDFCEGTGILMGNVVGCPG